jgi:hypothetical protein
MPETDALSKGKFGSDLFLSEFPTKIRVLTLDPLVYNDKYANTKYAFVVYNVDQHKVQIIDKTGGFAKRFQEIHQDEDFGGDIRKINIKITTNGKSGVDVRYNIVAVGSPSALSPEDLKVIKDAKIDLEAIIKKKAPGAIRLSEVNDGADLAPPMEDEALEPSKTRKEDVTIEDIGDEPINLDDIPF